MLNGFIKSWKTSAVSTSVWMVETQLCKLRGTSDITQIIVRACSMFYPYEGYRSVTPLDAAKVNRTIFHNYSVHWYYVTLMRVGIILSTILMWDMVNRTRVEGGGYSKHDIITSVGKKKRYVIQVPVLYKVPLRTRGGARLMVRTLIL